MSGLWLPLGPPVVVCSRLCVIGFIFATLHTFIYNIIAREAGLSGVKYYILFVVALSREGWRCGNALSEAWTPSVSKKPFECD
jgi:hypothetical protein